MCIVCRNMFDKRELIRVVKNKDGNFYVDRTGKMAGRGAYICKNEACHEKLKKTKVLNKNFKCEVPEQIYEELIKACKEKV